MAKYLFFMLQEKYKVRHCRARRACEVETRCQSERSERAATFTESCDLREGEVLARIDELVLLGAILRVVELLVAPAQTQQLRLRAALDDLAVLEHENLIRARDRREAVRDDERRAPAAQRAKPVANERLALAVEARCGLVENQDARIGENGARDRDALPLSAREAHAALADDRVVAVLELRDELIAVRDAARLADLLHRRAGLRERDVLARPCRRRGSCPAAPRPRCERYWRSLSDSSGRPSIVIVPRCGWLNAMIRLISVLFPEPLEPTSAVVDPAGAWKLTSRITGVSGLYSNQT